jgi:hypothetical protein
MNTIQKLATASWAVPLVYAFAARLVGLVIGRVLGDVLVFVVAVVGLFVAAFCLCAIPRLGRTGILLPAIGGLVLNGIVLAIWIPNFLAARERSQAGVISFAMPSSDIENIAPRATASLL